MDMAVDIHHAIADIVYKIQQKVKQEFYILPSAQFGLKMTAVMFSN